MKMVTGSEVIPYDRLLSTQEEADIKVIPHAVTFLQEREKDDSHEIPLRRYQHCFFCVYLYFTTIIEG